MSIRFGRSDKSYDSSQVMVTPDDDWRLVKDITERRKIQNRLAQRNYRRKIRQRLDELERGKPARRPTSNSSTSTTRYDSVDRTPSPALANSSPVLQHFSYPGSVSILPPVPAPVPVRSYYHHTDFAPLNTFVGMRSSRPSSSSSSSSSSPQHQSQNQAVWETCSNQSLPVGQYNAQPNVGEFPGNYYPQIRDFSSSPSPNFSSQLPKSPNSMHDLSLTYNKLANAAMAIDQILNSVEGKLNNEEAVSTLNKTHSWRLLENMENLGSPEKQLSMAQHPYISVDQYHELRNNSAMEDNKTGNYEDDNEDKICYSMYDGLNFWLQNPCSWEVAEGLAS